MKQSVPAQQVRVALRFQPTEEILVGRLALRHKAAFFEYAPSFITRGLAISPLMLPVQHGLKKSDPNLFEGLFGVFNDSLPDGWGRLLLDRKLRSSGINPHSYSPLDRLCAVGQHAIGALTYQPSYNDTVPCADHLELAQLAQDVSLIQEQDVFFEQILKLNGSSAGARPKALIGLHPETGAIISGVGEIPDEFEHWIVKFSHRYDDQQAGLIEYAYAEMAQLAGVTLPAVQLLQDRYFAIQRFDRDNHQRHHIISACGLLHADFRLPCLDYKDLVRACFVLTKAVKEVEKLYRLAVFNVLAHNRDDHSKNFSFVMDQQGTWRFSPAYDLTFSYGPGGEQSTLLMGESKQFTQQHLLDLAQIADIKNAKALEIIEQTTQALSQWSNMASNLGISRSTVQEIAKYHTVSLG